MDFGLFITAL